MGEYRIFTAGYNCRPMAKSAQPGQTVPSAPQKDKQAGELAATQRVEVSPLSSNRPKRWRWIFGGLGIFVLLLGLGAWTGYQTALSARTAQEALQGAVEANFQFQLGVQDLAAGQCARARDRFVYVIQLVPDYPQAQEQLIQASLCAGQGTAQPVAQEGEVDAGPTPTPDLRGAEQIFADAQNQLVAETWDNLLPMLDTLRKNYPDFQPLEADRMYYIAYRNRGMDRIIAGDLERGIFDLNRAEQIGPLDNDAANYRQWASMYIVGASFWEIDWAQAVQYFQQLAVAAPGLHDNFYSSQERLALALVGYAGDLVLEAESLVLDKQWCTAEAKMSEANGYSPLDSEKTDEWNLYIEKCALNGNE
jgi:hypothetical protein